MEMVRTQAEARFREAQDALPAHARVARAAAMFVWARGVIGREILARSGPLPAERLKWETAMRLYGSNATSRMLIQRMLDHVSG
ncbi:MAG: hypothetical protein WCQ77_15280 [Planctomycetota bacterium]|jgi:hypothetical protein